MLRLVGEPITTMDLAKKIGVHDLAVNYVLAAGKGYEASMVVQPMKQSCRTLINKQIETLMWTIRTRFHQSG